MTTTGLKPAYGYLRVSGNSQLASEDPNASPKQRIKDGFRRQRLQMEKYATAHGYEITKWFEEKAVRGSTEWTHRPAWVEMVSGMNGVRTIFVEKLDRLARDLMVQEHIIADLRRREVDLISVEEPDLCVDDPGRKLMRQVMGAFAEYDRAMIVAKLGGARRRMKEACGTCRKPRAAHPHAECQRYVTGRCEGRKPYGFREGEGEIVTRMRELRAAGKSYDQIAEVLKLDGRTTRNGKAWMGATVNKILARGEG